MEVWQWTVGALDEGGQGRRRTSAGSLEFAIKPSRDNGSKGETLPVDTSAPHQALAVNRGQE